MAESDEKILNEAKRRLQQAIDADRIDRENSIEDHRFTAGEQWDDVPKRSREESDPPRPVLVSNRIIQHLRRMENDVRQNRPEIRAIPNGGEATQKTANILTGIFRDIQYQSISGVVYSMAVHNQGSCGRGWIRAYTRYVDDNSFDQEILLGWVPNPHAVFWDPGAHEFFLEDAQWMFIVEDIPKKKFEKDYPDIDIQSLDVSDESMSGWVTDENIRVAEYFRIVNGKERKVYQLRDGEIKTDVKPGDDVLRERTVYDKKVEWMKICGSSIIDKPQKVAGKHIPVIPVWGDIFFLDGEIRRFGMTYYAKDEQRAYNYARSSSAELVGLAPLQPWMGSEEMFRGYEHLWNIKNASNGAPLVFNTDTLNPQMAPKRVEPPVASSALIAEQQWAAEGIKANFGQYDAALGATSNETSGKAIIARQKEGDNATYNFPDNLNMSLWRLGRIIFDMIPEVYDTDRAVRILNEDNSEDIVFINHLVDPASEVENDISKGTYSVKVITGPSYNTKRQEAAEAMLMLVQSSPEQMQILGDVLMENLDWNQADRLAKRYKKLLPPQLQEDENGNPVQPQIDPAQQAIQEHEMELAIIEREIKSEELNKVKIENEKIATQITIERNKAGAELEQIKLESEKIRAEITSIKKGEKNAKSNSNGSK